MRNAKCETVTAIAERMNIRQITSHQL